MISIALIIIATSLAITSESGIALTLVADCKVNAVCIQATLSLAISTLVVVALFNTSSMEIHVAIITVAFESNAKVHAMRVFMTGGTKIALVSITAGKSVTVIA